MSNELQELRDQNMLRVHRIEELENENLTLRRLINSPVTDDFMKALPLEAAHQALRWPPDHDIHKLPWEWYWVLSHLASKAVHAAVAGDQKKLKHHVITSAALLLTWYRHICDREERP